MKITTEQISTKIASHSLAAFYSEYPRGRGNYFSVHRGGGEYINVVNMGAEDLEDAIKLGVVEDTIEAIIFHEEGSCAAAWVIDSRLPDIVFKPRHWYGVPKAVIVKMLRHIHKPRGYECLCANERSKVDAFSVLRGARDKDDKWFVVEQCYECGTQQTRYK